jgi:ubiquinone/menaquinone biosynthesis C-methylase UbiE
MDLSRAFYDALGADRLAARTTREWDALTLRDLAEFLSPCSRILDVGCGYGRIALPLALAGHRVSGLDISETMIRAAQAGAEAAGVPIALGVGSMTDIPYPDSSFESVLCLWSAFHELLRESEQAQALREMWRVLSRGGIAIIEGALYTPSMDFEAPSGERVSKRSRIRHDMVEGRPNPHYAHDASTYEHLCQIAGIASFAVEEREWGGRTRLLLLVRKPGSAAESGL